MEKTDFFKSVNKLMTKRYMSLTHGLSPLPPLPAVTCVLIDMATAITVNEDRVWGEKQNAIAHGDRARQSGL